jgi:hypothetical protein
VTLTTLVEENGSMLTTHLPAGMMCQLQTEEKKCEQKKRIAGVE